MAYKVKEIYYTLQGEGAQTGRPAVFLRFSGCNLWSGREADRENAICRFCDTDFFGTDGPNGGSFATPEDLAEKVTALWPLEASGAPFVVCTGGEPYLQLDKQLIQALHTIGFEVGVETNGTLIGPDELDWVCVSPKAHTNLVIEQGNELKLVFPQKDLNPESLENLDFDHFYLQPMDGPDLEANIQKTVDYCLSNPRWKLSLQTHKLIGLP